MGPSMARRTEDREILDMRLSLSYRDWIEVMRVEEAGIVIGEIAPLTDNQPTVPATV